MKECVEYDIGAPGSHAKYSRKHGAQGAMIRQRQYLGHLPINECYFVGEGHAGIAAGRGCIVILHVPTGDVWNLSTLGGRSLSLARIINGKKIPHHLQSQVQALRSQAIEWCGGVLNPVHPESEIVRSDLSHRISEPLSALSPHSEMAR